MEINSLIIETTRQCQLECEHCLRGDAEPLNMRPEYMEKLLENVTDIGSVTFSGGEPFLHPETIHEFVGICKRNEIDVGGFYIATNGLIFEKSTPLAERGLLAIIKLYSFCSDNEMSRVDISTDDFHYKTITKNNLLYVFGITGTRSNLSYDTCVAEGRAENWGGRIEDNSIDWDYPDEVCVYLNCEGKVCWNCDLSYDSQRECGINLDGAQHMIGQINEAREEQYA